MMTRKGFTALADALGKAEQRARREGLGEDATKALSLAGQEICEALKGHNPRFDSLRFGARVRAVADL
jgi:hypothetical protein